jgi:hypothetical protein
MAKKKTVASMTKLTCPECGGVKWSRGFKHTKGCSMAFVPNKPKARGVGRKNNRKKMGGASMVGNAMGHEGRNGGKLDLRVLRGMGAEELLTLKHKIDDMLKSKLPELKEKMSMWERMILSISSGKK